MAAHMFQARFKENAVRNSAFRSLASDIDNGSTDGSLHTVCDSQKMVAHVHPGTGGETDGSSNRADALPLQVNSLTGCPVETRNFKGQVLFLHRQDAGRDHPYVDHFSCVKRQCEFRVQGVFKKVPKELYGVIETEKPTRLGYTSRALVSALLTVGCAIADASGAPIIYNVDMEHDVEGNAARHYVAFPVYTCECVWRTPAGGKPPPITQPLPEMTVREKIDELEKMEDGDMLTFAFWDQNLNLEKMAVCNMPLGLNVGLSSILGDRSLHVAFYEWVGSGEGMLAGVHSQANKEYLFSIVIELVGHEQTHRINVASAEDAHASTKDSMSSYMSIRRRLGSVLKQFVCRLCDGQGRR